MSQKRPRDFTDEDAIEFKLAMKDPERWRALHEKVEKINKENRDIYRDVKKPVNEQGFTDEEISFLKESLSNDENMNPQNIESQDMITDDDLKFFDDEFEKGGRRRRKNRRTKKRTSRRSKKRYYKKKRHTKRRRM